ncbi:alanine--tRNA ligase-related protein [Paenarthrobacter nicotinovorans]|uniref:alanine--tRNA ligase-related protein n=1 Tax=Paenarthrobacter nicotinovorans TaxID=29320 RepID=UPI002485BE12|nr:alanine--tRNA ligase-related protein [Paenarthrobacter nicotinovorans]MDI2020098.1 Alanine--tRNA ligase [Paenarthrobacter nicotinovorans]
MTAQQIRQGFLDHQRRHAHAVLDRAPLIPLDDPTTLFTGSGMQPLLPYLLGAEHPQGDRLADSQPCLRSQDIEEVGDNRHTTFFEMLGNWSLGSYFKDEQIPAMWDFLINVVGLDPERIYVSVFGGDPERGIPRDEESADIWERLFKDAGISHDRIDLGTEEHGNAVGNQGARIAFYGDKNWWSRGGSPDATPIGDPCGPDTEVFYFFPEVEHDIAYGEFSHQNSDGGQYLEIGNSVFMEYQRQDSGFVRLPRHQVDFGGGLERIAAAAIGSPDVFRISLLWPIVQALEELTGVSYEEHKTALRVITDHVRGAVFLALDGVKPGNKQQGYVMRRLLRRAMRFAHELGVEKNFLSNIVPVVVGIYAEDYPQLAEKESEIRTVLDKEERAFRRTLAKGLREMRQLSKEGDLDGAAFFTLYDTFGFPLELSREEAQRQNFPVTSTWEQEFQNQMDEQRQRSQKAATLGVH